MTTYAQISDVQTRLGRPLTDDETAQVPTLLGDVEMEIKARIPDLDDQVTAETIDSAAVVRVEASSVVRLIRNPNGYTSETNGDYSYQINYKLNPGELAITDKEWSLLGVGAGVLFIAALPGFPPVPSGETDPYWAMRKWYR